MMFALILDVVDNTRHVLFADTENAVTVLPFEGTHVIKGLMNPPRRFAFQPLDYLARSELRFSQYKHVYVILGASHVNGNGLVFSRYATDECPDTLFDLPADEIPATLCREDDVIEEM